MPSAGAPSPDAPVLVLISVDPETSHRANEAIRIALGIIAGENDVIVALLGPGAKVLDAEVEDYVDGEDILKHLGTLRKLGQVFLVQREAMRDDGRGGDWNPVGVDVVPVDGARLATLVSSSRRILVF